MDKAVDEGFVTPAARHIIVSAHTAQDLMCKLEVPTLSIILFSSSYIIIVNVSFSFHVHLTLVHLIIDLHMIGTDNTHGVLKLLKII